MPRSLGSVALRRPVRDHFCRDGAGGDALSAGRFAVIRGRGRRGTPGVTAPTSAFWPRFLVVAAVLGDAVNYSIGYFVGPKVFSRENSWLLNKKHLERAQKFYDDYGGDHHRAGAVHSDCSHVRSIRRGHRQDELPAVRRVQRRGRDGLDSGFSAGRLVVRRPDARPGELQAADRRHHRDLGDCRAWWSSSGRGAQGQRRVLCRPRHRPDCCGVDFDGTASRRRRPRRSSVNRTFRRKPFRDRRACPRRACRPGAP